MGLVLVVSLTFLLGLAVRFPFIWGAATVVFNDSDKGKAIKVDLMGMIVFLMTAFIPLLNMLTGLLVLATDYSTIKSEYDKSGLAAFSLLVMITIMQGAVLTVLVLIFGPEAFL